MVEAVLILRRRDTAVFEACIVLVLIILLYDEKDPKILEATKLGLELLQPFAEKFMVVKAGVMSLNQLLSVAIKGDGKVYVFYNY